MIRIIKVNQFNNIKLLIATYRYIVMEKTEARDTTEARHRKEKKELQSQVTALKKIIKNDKSKKKEISAEIIKLEIELENRQKLELDAIKSSELSEPCSVSQEETVEILPAVKLSKAQKRRDKKAQQEREREKSIKEQEKDNINGPRNVERAAILARLKARNLKMYDIPSDGDCLYKAITHQMHLLRDKLIPVEELRIMASNYIRTNKDDFIPFMCNPDTYEMLLDVEFEEYCNKIAETKVWGGQIEIRALTNCLKCPITVIQATGPDSIEQGTEHEGPALVLTYHRHMYSLGEHYNSTLPLDGQIQETEEQE